MFIFSSQFKIFQIGLLFLFICPVEKFLNKKVFGILQFPKYIQRFSHMIFTTTMWGTCSLKMKLADLPQIMWLVVLKLGTKNWILFAQIGGPCGDLYILDGCPKENI